MHTIWEFENRYYVGTQMIPRDAHATVDRFSVASFPDFVPATIFCSFLNGGTDELKTVAEVKYFLKINKGRPE